MPSFFIPDVLQLLAGLGLLNVWLLRPRSATSYRGGEAQTLKEEFAAYGLPAAGLYVVGALKITAALMFIAGIWLPLPVEIAAGVVALLMIGALAMHVKVKDPMLRSLPAALMLMMTLGILLLR